MRKYACQYAIVRFLPYVETGEFANVGIVLSCPAIGYFNFKLLTRVRRITAFFEELDAQIYRAAKNDFNQELQRIRNWLNQEKGEAKQVELAKQLFAELTRPREAIMRFDGRRVVMTDDPAQQLDELFAHYVERNFATKEYQEKLLEQNVRKILVEANLNKLFQAGTVGNMESYHAKFPFVHFDNQQPIKAIKPLHLAHADPAQIYDHGWAWYGKVEKLRALGLLPKNVLFPVQGPSEEDQECFEMFQDITKRIASNYVQVIDALQTEQILDFVRH